MKVQMLVSTMKTKSINDLDTIIRKLTSKPYIKRIERIKS